LFPFTARTAATLNSIRERSRRNLLTSFTRKGVGSHE
jgi:hypothetical protein